MQINKWLETAFLSVCLVLIFGGCDLRGGSQTGPMGALDRFRIESLKTLGVFLEGDPKQNKQLRIPATEGMKGNPFLAKGLSIDYRIKEGPDGRYIWEQEAILANSQREDRYGNTILARRPSGEIRFLTKEEFRAETGNPKDSFWEVRVFWGSE